MSYYFFLLTAEESEDPRKTGLSYVLENRSRWIQNDTAVDFLSPGYNTGNDFVVHNNKSYFVKKTFLDIDSSFAVYMCTESIMGCDN